MHVNDIIHPCNYESVPELPCTGSCQRSRLQSIRRVSPVSGHTKIHRHHGTHGTDFIGCRRGEGGPLLINVLTNIAARILSL